MSILLQCGSAGVLSHRPCGVLASGSGCCRPVCPALLSLSPVHVLLPAIPPLLEAVSPTISIIFPIISAIPASLPAALRSVQSICRSLPAIFRSIPASDIRPDVRLHWAECHLASDRKQGDIRPNVTRAKASKHGEAPLNNGETPSAHGAEVRGIGAGAAGMGHAARRSGRDAEAENFSAMPPFSASMAIKSWMYGLFLSHILGVLFCVVAKL